MKNKDKTEANTMKFSDQQEDDENISVISGLIFIIVNFYNKMRSFYLTILNTITFH